VPTSEAAGDSEVFWHHDIHEEWSSFSFLLPVKKMLSHELFDHGDFLPAGFLPSNSTTSAKWRWEFFCASGVQLVKSNPVPIEPCQKSSFKIFLFCFMA